MDPINKTSGGSKKILYIVIGILVILFIGGYIYMNGWFRTNKVNGTEVSRNLNGSTTIKGTKGSVTLNNNTIPENWPTDAPTYKNAKIERSFSSDYKNGKEELIITSITSDSMKTVVDFYQQELLSKDWTIVKQAEFSVNTTGIFTKKGDRIFNVTITNQNNGQIKITTTTSQ